MSQTARFEAGLTTLQAEAIKLKEIADQLNEQNASAKAMDLIVLIKAFNLLGGSSAPMMSRQPKTNSNGVLDEGSQIAAALTHFIQIHQQLLNITIGSSGASGPPMLSTPVAAALHQAERVVDTIAYELIQAMPKIEGQVSGEAAKKAEADYKQGVVNSIASKIHEPWMANYAPGLQSGLKETATIIDNLGDYLQKATPQGIAGDDVTKLRQAVSDQSYVITLERSMNRSIISL
ncbi:hypothetical protein ASPACDRAFT_46513 [Aspergillus aculeatus ATCC 16872]|uniref:Uncharacterized protein n=1 Tax=Aspergillus aculeatus (strain ATCC 16872 / CBS 172.66 / WB 5094) TaxID=690307 RepID=A0A1L9WLF3_ASPA1|nr:uncharacterized protein ASPACDRAFT_46513 [Aspergillus aculeatus ATCC 16872]OJJ96989.1 hypothetical protein ASPACDRAFT_46513 [Aspergillus aculeatus ATCC 16872]